MMMCPFNTCPYTPQMHKLVVACWQPYMILYKYKLIYAYL